MKTAFATLLVLATFTAAGCTTEDPMTYNVDDLGEVTSAVYMGEVEAVGDTNYATMTCCRSDGGTVTATIGLSGGTCAGLSAQAGFNICADLMWGTTTGWQCTDR